MSDSTTPKLTTFQDVLMYMSVQMEAMDVIETKIEQLDGDPGSNAVRDQEHRDRLVKDFEWHAAEYNIGLAAFNALSADQCDTHRLLNPKNIAA